MEVYDSLNEKEMSDMIKTEDEEIDYLDGKIKQAQLVESRIRKKKLLAELDEKRILKEQKKEQLQECRGRISDCKYLCNCLWLLNPIFTVLTINYSAQCNNNYLSTCYYSSCKPKQNKHGENTARYMLSISIKFLLFI